MTDACAWNLNAFCFISRDVFRGVDARGVGFCLDCWIGGWRGPPDIGNEIAEMIGFPEIHR